MEKSREYECFQAGSLPFPHVISTNFFLYTANSIIVFFWNPQILKLGPFGLGRGGLLHLGPKIARRSSPFSPSSPVLSSTDHRLSPQARLTAPPTLKLIPLSFPVLRSASQPPAAAWRGVLIHPGSRPIASLLAGKEP